MTGLDRLSFPAEAYRGASGKASEACLVTAPHLQGQGFGSNGGEFACGCVAGALAQSGDRWLVEGEAAAPARAVKVVSLFRHAVHDGPRPVARTDQCVGDRSPPRRPEG
jgi:hypothetical protein